MGATGIWEALEERTNPVRDMPQLAPDVEIRHFEPRHGDAHTMVANPRDLIYYRLTPDEAGLLPMLDGTRTPGQVVLERLGEGGQLDVAMVTDLVRLLYRGNFLTKRFVNTDVALEKALSPVSPLRASARGFVRTLSVEWSDAERLIRFTYRAGLRLVFTRLGILITALLAVTGGIAFISVVQSGRYQLTNRSFGVTFLVLFSLDLLIVFVHELGHASVLVHYHRRVKSAGFRIYFGSPAFFIESSDALMLGRRQRMLQSFAGPYAELVMAGVASLVLYTFPGGWLGPTLYQFTIINYYVLFLNLMPLLELDGYWLLSDGLEMPDLRPRSLAFIRDDLWRKIRRRERFRAADLGLGLYGVVGVIFTVACLVSAAYFWRRVFGDVVLHMWRGGPAGIVLLILLGLFLAGPLLRGLIAVVRATGRRLRGRWRARQFRREGPWRVEAAELLDESGLFGDIPVEVLNELAGRISLRAYGREEPIVRQGERADAYYLVRSGSAKVIEEGGDAGDRELRRVGRGEGFGELGLVRATVRNATVRAAEPAELFVIDKGTFDRLLADRIVLGAVAPTVQSIAELRALRPFAHLGPRDLLELAQRGEWVQLAAGEVVIRQGEVGDAFFVVGSGQLEVVQDERPVRTLQPGDQFGEIALLLDSRRIATVRALTPARVFRLDRQAFDRLLAAAFRSGHLRTNVAVNQAWEH